MGLFRWKELEDKFCEGIVLGNGASIAIDPRFSYSSLFENAKEKGLITTNVAKIVNHLRTKDFELVLRMLWHAYHINRALEIDDSATSKAYEDLREALIQAVRQIHVEYAQVSEHLLTIACFLKRFKTVISLNYDFLVYWAVLVGNEEWKPNWFKDCFIKGKFEEDWDRLREPYDNAEGSTLVFYPHGNLVLAADLFGGETKIATGEFGNLMDTVVEKWASGQYSPLFVSEGTSAQKLQAINRSPYLKNVYEHALKDLGTRIVIFGWSLGDHDEHVLNALCENQKLKAIAVSVVVSGDTEGKCDQIEKKIRKASGNREIEVIFFDAKSDGCWAIP